MRACVFSNGPNPKTNHCDIYANGKSGHCETNPATEGQTRPVRSMTEWGEADVQGSAAGDGQEVLARAGNLMVARAAFDTSVSLWPVAEIELRQGARIILKSKGD